MEHPTEGLATRIGRFPLGWHHWVYELVATGTNPVVVRIGARENRADLAGAVFWEKHLKPLGVPLAKILNAELDMEWFDYPVPDP